MSDKKFEKYIDGKKVDKEERKARSFMGTFKFGKSVYEKPNRSNMWDSTNNI